MFSLRICTLCGYQSHGKEAFHKKIWKVILTATIWTIREVRNYVVFKGGSFKADKVFILLKIRAVEWLQATQLLYKTCMVWWNNNPIGSVSGSLRHLSTRVSSHELELTGFIDGHLEKIKGVRVSSGIGGVIKLKDGSKVLEFLGPSIVDKIIDVELDAFRALKNLLNQNGRKASSILVY